MRERAAALQRRAVADDLALIEGALRRASDRLYDADHAVGGDEARMLAEEAGNLRALLLHGAR